MISELFITFFLLSVLFIFIGLFSRKFSVLIIGSVLIILIGFSILFNGVSFRSGDITTTDFSYDDDNVSQSVATTVYNYTSPSFDFGNIFGLLVVFGGVACLLSWRYDDE